MAQIPETVVESVRDRVDIVDLIGRHVTLKRTGKQWRGLCPFHGEKTPSFYVDPIRKSFKCFGCGEWGDAIDFVRKTEGKSFVEAVRSIGEGLGIAVPAPNYRTEVAVDEHARRDQAFAILRLARDVYRRTLLHAPIAEKARAYQQSRQVSDELAELFGLGYAPHPNEAGWDTLTRALVEAGHSLEVAEQVGVIVRSERTGKPYDRFRGRWMFPIMLPGGTVAGFSGRVLPEFECDDNGEKVAKYINSPESLVYKKSELLFGLHAAAPGIRARSRVVLVEGNVDVLAMHRAGFGEVVAPLGTALTPTQCERLFRYTDTAVLCFDGDKAGTMAMWKAVPVLLAAGFDVRVAALPEGQDPDSVVPERLSALLERPTPALSWILRRMVAAGATASPDAKDRALRAFVPLLREVQRPEVRADYVEQASALLQVPALRVSNLVALAGKNTTLPVHYRGMSRGEPNGPSRPSDWRSRDLPAGVPPEMAMDERQQIANNASFGGEFSPRPLRSVNAPESHRAQNWTRPAAYGEKTRQDRPFQRTPFAQGSRSDRPPFGQNRDFSGQRPPIRTFGPPSVALAATSRPNEFPPGQVMLVALLIDRPELASLADRAGVRALVRDFRLAPLVNAVLDAALQGERQPSEGELLTFVDGAFHRDLHERVFVGNYLEIEDPRRQLEEGVRLCARALIDDEIAQIDRESQAARDTGDEPKLRELQQRRLELRRRQAELRVSQFTV